MVAMTVSVVLAMEHIVKVQYGPVARYTACAFRTRSPRANAFLSRFDLVSVAFQSRVERLF